MLVGFIVVAALLLTLSSAATAQGESEVTTGYVDVNDLHMYYEIHGTGEPLVVLHGAYMSTDVMAPVIQAFAETRQVIAVDLQAHGRTNDVADRPLSYEQMADDVAALMTEIGIEKADVFGYSMGGSTALQIAIRHPEMVDKLVIASATYNREGWHEDLLAMFDTMTPDMFVGSFMETEYAKTAPNPEGFRTLVEKLIALDRGEQDWPAEQIQSITAPTMVIVGDSDTVRPDHALDLFQLRGGNVNGDLVGLPNAQLAILPGTTHISTLMRVNWFVPMVVEFLDGTTPAPMMG
jgi:pimeloyl-ACP methyl ester carboxylesterase